MLNDKSPIADAVIGNGDPKPNGAATESQQPQVDEGSVTHPLPEDLQRLRQERTSAETQFEAIAARRTLARGFGIPVFVVVLAMLAGKNWLVFFTLAPDLLEPILPAGRILILWVTAALIVGPFYYFFIHKAYVQARDRLTKLEETEIAWRLSTVTGRRQYFREQLFRLTSKAASVFFGDEERFAEASAWAEKAGNALDNAAGTADLGIVQTNINSLSELVAREQAEQRDEKRWQFAAVVTMLLYVAILVSAAVWTSDDPNVLESRIIGVPLSVILWGAAGSLGAILYRFYTEQGRIRFAAEFRWLVARPVIGIIMGAVVYLALASGLMLLVPDGAARVETANTAWAGRKEAFWIIAFLAGFSDKFYLGVIDLLVARTVSTKEINGNTVITKTERVPDASGEHKPEEPKRDDAT
jgi:hypothetical protein